jgi:hypothetical protein
MDPGRGYDRGLLCSTFRTRLHENDYGRRACGADDVEGIYSGGCSEKYGFRWNAVKSITDDR